MQPAADVTRLVCRVSNLENELSIEKHKRKLAEMQAARLRGALGRLMREKQKAEPQSGTEISPRAAPSVHADGNIQ
jgi:hypothetical protein